MADIEQIAILRQGAETWNAWREQNAQVRPDLRGANLRGANLQGANLNGAILRGVCLTEAVLIGTYLNKAIARRANLANAYLHGAYLCGADLKEADLSYADLSAAQLVGAHLHDANLSGALLNGAILCDADLYKADLHGADLQRTDLRGADLSATILREADLEAANLQGANLRTTDLTGANLTGANLRYSTLVRTKLDRATLSDCMVYGIAAWDVQLEGALQSNLAINGPGEPSITVDNLKVAQFLYLMLHNEEIRDVIDTLTSKVALILGRFTPERKIVLDALREALRLRNYVPVLFDFDVPSERNVTETVTLLARVARFIIADLTDPSSLPQELQAIVPDVMVPVQPLLLDGAAHHSMFPDFRRYPWMLPIYRYASLEALLATMQERVIAPAEAKVHEVRKLRQAEGVDSE